MTTPAHAVLNLLVLGGGHRRILWLPIFLGSLLPDVPMLGFYFLQRVILREPESYIWSHVYFQPNWQALFDIFNSFPLIVVGLIVAYWVRSDWLQVFFLSIGLHCMADFLLHHDDAHRHFLPLSDWRLLSPVSYWDHRYYGQYVTWAEMALVLVGSVILFQRHKSPAARVLAGVTLVSYLGYLVYALTVWASLDGTQ
jgi:hypothetical protein